MIIEKDRILARIDKMAISRGIKLHEESLERLAMEVLEIRDGHLKSANEFAEEINSPCRQKTQDEIEAYVMKKMEQFLDICREKVGCEIDGHTWGLIDEDALH